MQLTVRNEFVLDDDGKIQWKYLKYGVYEHYWVRVYLVGTKRDLSTVEQTTYILHPTFPNRRRVSEDPDNQFEILIWTYGDFSLVAEVLLKSGEILRLRHNLALDLPADEDEYVQFED
jgi:transcription initiation factor IIF auxiliary subunit